MAAGEDSEGEWEEEEQLVVVHLSGVIDTEYLKKCDSNNCKVLGVETDEPVLQIDQMCFCGTYDDSIGTNIIFEEKGEVISGKEEKHLEYMCHTTKNLDMIRIFLKEDHDDDNEEGKESQKPANRNDDDEQEDKVQENAAPHENNENMADNSKESEMQSANLTQPSERTENEDLTDQMDAT